MGQIGLWFVVEEAGSHIHTFSTKRWSKGSFHAHVNSTRQMVPPEDVLADLTSTDWRRRNKAALSLQEGLPPGININLLDQLKQEPQAQTKKNLIKALGMTLDMEMLTVQCPCHKGVRCKRAPQLKF